MRRWIFGIVIVITALLIGLASLYMWESRDLSPEEWYMKRAESMGWAVEQAAKKLPEHVKQAGLKPDDFRGPYIKIDPNNIEWPTQKIAYKNDSYYFIYDQMSNNVSFFKRFEEDCDSETCQWLDSMP